MPPHREINTSSIRSLVGCIRIYRQNEAEETILNKETWIQ